MIGEEEGADADSAPWIAVLVWCGKKVNFLPFRFCINQSGSGSGFESGLKIKWNDISFTYNFSIYIYIKTKE
jgi:hypothetical protein